jgi:hypothetical protein
LNSLKEVKVKTTQGKLKENEKSKPIIDVNLGNIFDGLSDFFNGQFNVSRKGNDIGINLNLNFKDTNNNSIKKKSN